MKSNFHNLASHMEVGRGDPSFFLFPDVECGLLKAPQSQKDNPLNQYCEVKQDLFDEIIVTTSDLNLIGCVFGGRALEWGYHASLSLAAARLSGIAGRDLILGSVEYEFLKPMLLGDCIRYAPQLSFEKSRMIISLDVLRESLNTTQEAPSYELVGKGKYSLRFRNASDVLRVPLELGGVLKDYDCRHSVNRCSQNIAPILAVSTTMGYIDLGACSTVWHKAGKGTLAAMATRVFRATFAEPVNMESTLILDCETRHTGKTSVTVDTRLLASDSSSSSSVIASGSVVVVKR